MARREFSPTVRDQAFARCGGICGICKQPLQPGKIEYDHILPDALGGKPILANCMPVCSPCHKAKTSKEDVPRIRKADRQRRAHIGAKRPAGSIKSAPFPKPPEQRRASGEISKLAGLPRRSVYQEG